MKCNETKSKERTKTSAIAINQAQLILLSTNETTTTINNNNT